MTSEQNYEGGADYATPIEPTVKNGATMSTGPAHEQSRLTKTSRERTPKAAPIANKRQVDLTNQADSQFSKKVVSEVIEQLLTTYGPSVLCGLQIHFHTHVDQSVSLTQSGNSNRAEIDYNGSCDRS